MCIEKGEGCMASLSRGISFRRQGSSGVSWTDTWSFNEEGVLVRSMREEVAMQQQQTRFGGAALSRIHDLHFLAEVEAQGSIAAAPSSSSSSTVILPHAANCPPSPGRLSRSKSLGSVAAGISPSQAPPRKPGFRFLRWIKKTFTKSRSRA